MGFPVPELLIRCSTVGYGARNEKNKHNAFSTVRIWGWFAWSQERTPRDDSAQIPHPSCLYSCGEGHQSVDKTKSIPYKSFEKFQNLGPSPEMIHTKALLGIPWINTVNHGFCRGRPRFCFSAWFGPQWTNGRRPWIFLLFVSFRGLFIWLPVFLKIWRILVIRAHILLSTLTIFFFRLGGGLAARCRYFHPGKEQDGKKAGGASKIMPRGWLYLKDGRNPPKPDTICNLWGYLNFRLCLSNEK